MASRKSTKKPQTKRPGRRGAGAGLSRHGDAAKVEVRADPARKKRFDALLSEMHRSERTEASGFDAYWEAVSVILDADLWVLGGHETADAFLATEVKEPRRTALRNVRVARLASPAEEAKYGTTLLDAALS